MFRGFYLPSLHSVSLCEVQGCKGARLQRCKAATLQGCEFAWMQNVEILQGCSVVSFKSYWVTKFHVDKAEKAFKNVKKSVHYGFFMHLLLFTKTFSWLLLSALFTLDSDQCSKKGHENSADLVEIQFENSFQ